MYVKHSRVRKYSTKPFFCQLKLTENELTNWQEADFLGWLGL